MLLGCSQVLMKLTAGAAFVQTRPQSSQTPYRQPETSHAEQDGRLNDIPLRCAAFGGPAAAQLPATQPHNVRLQRNFLCDCTDCDHSQASTTTPAAHQCNRVWRMTGLTVASSQRLLLRTTLFARARIQRPLSPTTPRQREICRASSSERRPV